MGISPCICHSFSVCTLLQGFTTPSSMIYWLAQSVSQIGFINRPSQLHSSLRLLRHTGLKFSPSQLYWAYMLFPNCGFMVWPSKVHASLGSTFQRGRSILPSHIHSFIVWLPQMGLMVEYVLVCTVCSKRGKFGLFSNPRFLTRV